MDFVSIVWKRVFFNNRLEKILSVGEIMKLKKEGLGIYFIVVAIFILWYHCFYLFGYPAFLDSILNQANFIIIIVAFGLISTWYCFKNYKKYLYIYRNWLIKYLFGVLITFILVFIYSQFKYSEQSVVATLRVGAKYLVPFLIPVFLVIFERDGGTEKLLNVINFIMLLFYVVAIIQSYHYAMTGQFLLDFRKFYYGDIYTRVYGIRVSLGAFGNIMIPYNFSKLYEKNQKGKWFNIVQLILGLYCLVFVQQTRAWIVVVGISIAFQLFFGPQNTKMKVFQFTVVLAVFICLAYTDFFHNIVNTYSEIKINEGSVSTDNRLYAIQYYLSCFMRNMFFGNGFAWCDRGSPYFNVEHGPLGIAYYGDVGFIGLLGQVGLCSFIFFFAPMIRIGKNLKSIFKIQDKKSNGQFTVSLFVYLISSSVTLIVTDTGLSLLFPLAIAYFAYEAVERS